MFKNNAELIKVYEVYEVYEVYDNKLFWRQCD